MAPSDSVHVTKEACKAMAIGQREVTIRIGKEEISTADRLNRAEGAAKDVLAQLQAQFLETEGYRYKVRTRTMQESAFCRDIRVNRGLNFGFYVIIKGTDRKMSGVKLTVGRESKLTTILGIVAFIGAIGAPYGFASASGKLFSGSQPDMTYVYALMIGGLVVGMLAAVVVRFISLPLVRPNSEVANKLMGALQECVTRTTSGD
jgi:hypothetical protein